MATGTKLLKKLTIRAFIGTKLDILAYALSAFPGGKPDGKSAGDPVPVLQVLGNVTSFKAGESDFGSYVELRGDFRATNLQTGEILEACNKCILPSVVGDAVASSLANGAESVQFAVELDVRYAEKAATMYEFDARTLLKPATAKPIDALLGMMAQQGIEMTKPKQLAAPKLSEDQKKAQVAAEAAADALKKAAAEKATTEAVALAGKGKGKGK